MPEDGWYARRRTNTEVMSVPPEIKPVRGKAGPGQRGRIRGRACPAERTRRKPEKGASIQVGSDVPMCCDGKNHLLLLFHQLFLHKAKSSLFGIINLFIEKSSLTLYLESYSNAFKKIKTNTDMHEVVQRKCEKHSTAKKAFSQ